MSKIATKIKPHFHVREIKTFGYMDVPKSAKAFATREEAADYENELHEDIATAGISTLANIEVSSCDKPNCKLEKRAV